MSEALQIQLMSDSQEIILPTFSHDISHHEMIFRDMLFDLCSTRRILYQVDVYLTPTVIGVGAIGSFDVRQDETCGIIDSERLNLPIDHIFVHTTDTRTI